MRWMETPLLGKEGPGLVVVKEVGGRQVSLVRRKGMKRDAIAIAAGQPARPITLSRGVTDVLVRSVMEFLARYT